MTEIKTNEDYVRAIAVEWIKHATESDRLATEPGTLFEQGYHAFMANAISLQMAKSADASRRELFSTLIRAYA